MLWFYANLPISMLDRCALLFSLETDEMFLIYGYLTLSVIVKSGTAR